MPLSRTLPLAVIILSLIACQLTAEGDLVSGEASSIPPGEVHDTPAGWYTLNFTDPGSPASGSFQGGPDKDLAAAIREAREETGIEIAPKDLEVVGVMHRRSDDERIDFFLLTKSWSGRVRNREPKKCDRVAWFGLDELPENVIPYVRRALENYRHGRWFDSLGWR